MKDPGVRRPTAPPLRAMVWLLAAGGTLWMAFGSMERGNRLFRSGNPERAAALYADAAQGGRRAAVRRYNLGTALLARGSDDAPRMLEGATAAADREVSRRAHYNLGYAFLSEANPEEDPYTATLLLSSAIEHSRAALRLDPSDEDARWNLAVALRAYAELAQVVEEAPAEAEGGDVSAPEDPLEAPRAASGLGGASDESEGVPPPTEPGDPTGSRSGADQTAAFGDPGPLSETAALELLDGEPDDTGTLIRGLLWSNRPDESAPIDPGGRW